MEMKTNNQMETAVCRVQGQIGEEQVKKTMDHATRCDFIRGFAERVSRGRNNWNTAAVGV